MFIHDSSIIFYSRRKQKSQRVGEGTCSSSICIRKSRRKRRRRRERERKDDDEEEEKEEQARGEEQIDRIPSFYSISLIVKRKLRSQEIVYKDRVLDIITASSFDFRSNFTFSSYSFSKMGLLIKSTPILLTLLALVNCVAADAYYIGPTVGGVLGLVSNMRNFKYMKNDRCYFLFL